MPNTDIIYSNFKKSITAAVHTTKINNIVRASRFNYDYLFAIENSDDTFYSGVIRDMENAALQEVELLLLKLSEAYGYPAHTPRTPASYDVIIQTPKEAFFVELKSQPHCFTQSKIHRSKPTTAAVTYVYLLKQSSESYRLLSNSPLANTGCREYLFADFLCDAFGKDEMDRFNKSMRFFAQEMRDAIGYSVTQICNEKNLDELRNRLRSEILIFDYDRVRINNDSGGTYTEYINDNVYNAIKAQFNQNYLLLLGQRDFAISFLTSEWLYRQFASVHQIDNTFIAAGYFKSIEQLLWGIIFIVGNGRNIGKSNHTVGNNETGMDQTLGSLRYFLNNSSNDDLYQSAFGNAIRYVRQYLNRQLDSWISNIRNGYFHKHNMSAEAVEEVREQTYFLYLLILGSLTLSADTINELLD